MIGIVLAFQAAIWLALSYLFIRSSNASIFHPFAYYLAFHGVVFVIWPILQYVFDFESMFYYMWFYPSEGRMIFALWLATLGLFCFAYFNWMLDRTVPRLDRPNPPGYTADEWRAFVILAILLVPLALYSFYLYMGTSAEGGALISMWRDPETGISVNTNSTGYLTLAHFFLIPLSLILIWGTRFRLWSFLPFMVQIAMQLYIGWGRWAIVLPMVMLGLLFLLHRKKRWIPLSFIAVAIPVFIVFQQLGENRGTYQSFFTGESVTRDLPNYDRWIDRFDTADFANIDYLTYIIDVVPEQSGTYSYFTHYLQIFTEPVPRILWPGKPIGPPINLVNLNDYGNFVGLTTSIIGDGWISAGFIGVAITLGIVGFLTARMHRWFWSGDSSNLKILTYCIFVPLTIQWYRDGGISITKFMLLTMGPVFLWRGILRVIQSAASRRRSKGGDLVIPGPRTIPLRRQTIGQTGERP